MRSTRLLTLAAATLLLASVGPGGCTGTEFGAEPVAQATTGPAAEVLLPQRIRIHPFTGTREFDPNGGISGIEARIEAIDAFGDSTKALGEFRFELFRFAAHEADPRGERIGVWVRDLSDVEENRLYWDSLSRTYQFRLAWTEAVPVGQKFVLLTVFASPGQPRLFDQRVFVSGE